MTNKITLRRVGPGQYNIDGSEALAGWYVEQPLKGGIWFLVRPDGRQAGAFDKMAHLRMYLPVLEMKIGRGE